MKVGDLVAWDVNERIRGIVVSEDVSGYFKDADVKNIMNQGVKHVCVLWLNGTIRGILVHPISFLTIISEA